MKLYKIISGGQTGADITGLECARALGLETGGSIPKGFRTDVGNKPSFGKIYGLVETPEYGYLPRTMLNVMRSDATLWFGDVSSPGGKATTKFCKIYGRPMILNIVDMRPYAELYGVINIAGNRQRTNPDVVQQVKDAFATLKLHPDAYVVYKEYKYK